MNPLVSLLTVLVKVLLISGTGLIGARLILFEYEEWREMRAIRKEKRQ